MKLTLNFNFLTLVFVVLKVTGNIDWSWLWVLAPTWIPFVLIVPFILIAAAISVKANKG